MENTIDGCFTVPEDERYFCLTAKPRHDNRLYIVSANSFDSKVQHEGARNLIRSLLQTAENIFPDAISRKDSFSVAYLPCIEICSKM